ncbi:MAG: hypothetical protein M0R76_11580 [Proteobacteria bacterium]|nr:hypothetical protein [Pseudomonadota bacterium]
MGASVAIFFLSSFAIGGLLMLERRCVGQMAFVQPLAILLIAGFVAGAPAPALWLGVTLQLLATGQTHYCNWVLVAVSAAFSLIALQRWGVVVQPGDAPILAVLAFSTIWGIASFQFDKWLARKDNAVVELLPHGVSEETVEPFIRLVHRRVARNLLISGLQSVLAVGLSVLAGLAAHIWLPAPNPVALSVMQMAIPAFGVVAVLSSLVDWRFTSVAAATALLSTAWWMWGIS